MKSPPLKSIMNQQKNGLTDGQAIMVQKQKEENALLHNQAELLVKELAHSNSQILEMDMTIALLEKELKGSWELSRKCKIFRVPCDVPLLARIISLLCSFVCNTIVQ
jgi:hypothetical protein